MDVNKSGTPLAVDCDELRDLLPAYGFGLLTPAETARVDSLLPYCPEVAAELPDYAAMSASLLLSTEAVAPPPSLRGSLLARLGEQESGSSAPASVPIIALIPPPAHPRRVPRWLWGAVAAAVLLLVATNALWFTQWRETRTALETAQLQVSLYQQRQTNLIRAAAGDTPTVRLFSTTDSAQPIGTVFWDAQAGSATLISDQLTALSPAETYQLWLIDGAQVNSAGVFAVGETGETVYTFDGAQVLATGQLIAISVEPAGGSPAPTRDPLAVGEV